MNSNCVSYIRCTDMLYIIHVEDNEVGEKKKTEKNQDGGQE